ncbi:branched-chain amino acid ABC transporter ATP-binding protein/permease [Roseomonas marmotae]|uniref:Branched-chain amino acid ABC transporter ATP-binding protein/permease n=1 Tax=Roseomonas marmotae TaxID=2768161 RepID=A0ABS3KHF2_9PROT|nr:branched-chain amino acid ABC transporter ATP-binding protein/permease [Roseomonas marmotae]MBO1076904.1 branched-chain amino acid ABC transporter ATP-binding protein/permease [Roseomonas marmotae]
MRDRSILRPFGLFLLLALAWLAIGFVVQDAYWRLMLTLVPIWALLAVSWNIFSGYSGLVSFGHAAFFGLGAYLVALGQARFGLTPWLGIPLAAVLGGAAGAAIGYPTFRLRGNYFALAMLAYPLMLVSLFGWLGFQEVSVPLHREAPGWYMQFSDGRAYIAIALGLLAVGFAASLLVERSRFGLSLLAIKQNELAAEAAGIDTVRWKLRAMILSGALAAAAGGLYAVVLLVVTPNSVFGLVVSAQAMILSLFGGAGTVWGPLIGSIVLVPLGETLQAELGHILPGIQGVIYGIAVIVVILAAPEGLYWKLRDLRRAPPAAPPASVAPVAEQQEAPRPPLGSAILEVEGLSKAYGGVQAVSDISFSVRQGEILGIIGPNGAGKTTLFNLLNGLVQPSQGSVRYEGKPLSGLRPSGVCRRGIGRTFQVVRAFPRMSVRENVVVGAFVAHGTDAEATRAADAALAQVGLAHRASATAGALTNRELRLMELARALAAGPRLVLLDEPLAGLGSTDTDALIAVVRKLPAQGITVVIIEHSMPAMLTLVDRFLVLDNGRLLTEGPPQEVLRQPAVVEAYLGRKWATADAEG